MRREVGLRGCEERRGLPRFLRGGMGSSLSLWGEEGAAWVLRRWRSSLRLWGEDGAARAVRAGRHGPYCEGRRGSLRLWEEEGALWRVWGDTRGSFLRLWGGKGAARAVRGGRGSPKLWGEAGPLPPGAAGSSCPAPERTWVHWTNNTWRTFNEFLRVFFFKLLSSSLSKR